MSKFAMTHMADSILAAWLGLLTFAWIKHMRRDQRRWNRILKLLDRLDVTLDELS